jgi:hypothetical protein
VGEEHREVALADREGAAELLFGQRAKDEPDHARRYGNVQDAHAEADDADDPQGHEVDHVVVERVGAQRREDQDAGVEPLPGDLEQPHPHPGHRAG